MLAQRRDADPQHGADDGRAGLAARRQARAGDADDPALGLRGSQPQARHRPGDQRRTSSTAPSRTTSTSFGRDYLGHDRGRQHDRDPRQGPVGHDAHAPEDVIGTLVHETSHIIVADYGEHPKTSTDAGSFDRYKDEFRAYFIEPHSTFTGHGGGRARRRDPRAPRAARPWASAATPTSTRRSGPSRTTRTSSARTCSRTAPGRLQPQQQPVSRPARAPAARAEGGQGDGRGLAVPDHASSPPPSAPRRPAATLIPKLLAGLPGPEAERLKKALTSPATVQFGKEINPNASPRVTAFLEAVTGARARADHRDLQGLQPAGPRRPRANAHFLSWLRRVLPDELVMRTCITCMTGGRSFVFFERVRVFICRLRRRDRGDRDARRAAQLR